MEFTEEQIIDGNKKIARFIGLQFKSPIFSDKSFCPGYYTSKNKMVAMSSTQLKYHLSYDSLMPVVVAIKKINIDEKVISSSNLKIYSLSIMDDIMTVWEAVVEFVEWSKTLGSQYVDLKKISTFLEETK